MTARPAHGRRRRLWPVFQRSAVTVGRIASDALFPRRCLTCEALMPDMPNTYLCAACAEAMESFQGPCCAVCGQPFWTFGATFVPEGALCGFCRAKSPPFDTARAVGLYRGSLRRLILSMKYRPEAKAGFALAALLYEAYPRLFDEMEPEAVVPIPLHTERFLEREFDQSALMARELSRLAGWPYRRWLRRMRNTPPQRQMSRAGRRANVRGVFALAPRARPAGRTVLLVDDVMTTGATAREAARLLAGAGARAVHVYTAARVE